MNARDKIMNRLRELGVEPKRSLGQNFLVSDAAIQRILLASSASPIAGAVVEVGPGLGSLTDGLLELGRPVILIELDREFAAAWRARLDETQGRVVEADALALNWKDLCLPAGSFLASNLPYQISSSLVIERSVSPCGIDRMILMFQKEVAQRLMARHRTSEYGLLTAIAQTFWDVRFVLEAGPRDFHPAPRVASRVLEFRALPDPGLADRKKFLTFAKAAFAHRRKLVARNLASFAASESVAQGLLALGHDPQRARAEELAPSELVALFRAVGGA